MAQIPEPVAEKKSAKSTRAELIKRVKAEWTEKERVILQRRSVRIYEKEQVPDFMVKRILEAGRYAPSAGNCQPWKFIVLREPEIIDEITQDVIGMCKTFVRMFDYHQAGRSWLRPLTKVVIRFRHNDLHPVPFGAMKLIAEERLGVWHGAPTVILIFKDVRGVSSPDLDCGIAGQNMVLAAHSMGLGTCWTGFGKLAFQYSKKWKKRLNIEYPYQWAISLSIGWPKGEPDGMVARPTHPVEWYENGRKTLHE
jgi:nitroreductase